MERVKNLEHALEILQEKLKIDTLCEVDLPNDDIVTLVAHFKLMKIVQANNKLNNWRVDWNDKLQAKWNPYFWVKADDKSKKGFGFANPDAYWFNCTDVGSKLLVGTSEEAKYIAQDFIDLFEQAWL